MKNRVAATFARMLYDLFDERMEPVYRDFAEVSEEDSRGAVESAREFVTALKELTKR